jgi:hypothetical protein
MLGHWTVSQHFMEPEGSIPNLHHIYIYIYTNWPNNVKGELSEAASTTVLHSILTNPEPHTTKRDQVTWNLPRVGRPTEWWAAAPLQVDRLSARGPRAMIAAIEKSVALGFTAGTRSTRAPGPSSCIVPSNITAHNTPQFYPQLGTAITSPW